MTDALSSPGLQTNGVFQVSVVIGFEAEEPVAALLERIFGTPPTIWSNAESQESVVSVWLREPIGPRKGEVAEGLRALSELGLDLGRAQIRASKVRREDWSESWKKYFKTIEIGSSLLIKASWSKQKPKPGQAVVVLDPGLSFGTGQHATTSFCLKQIVAIRHRNRSARPLSLLDIGSGSGILSIAAARLGYAPVDAFDFDPVAVRVAQKNCRSNRVAGRISLSRKDLTKIPLKGQRRYDVICANLIAPLLIAERDRIFNRLASGGSLILAGILAREFGEVRRAWEEKGLTLLKTTTEREWQSGTFAALPRKTASRSNQPP